MARKSAIRRSTGETVFMVFNSLFMIFFCFITIYPFINTLAVSFNDGSDALRGGIYFLPRQLTTLNYATVFKDNEILRAYGVTISRTIIGVVTTLTVTGLLAYGLSKKHLVGRKVYVFICLVAMIFSAGLIPTYMLYKDVKLLNSFLVYILPHAVNIFNMILMKNFFEQLPMEIEESAMIDGAGTFRILLSVVLPVSMPIVATICIFTGVFQWNEWFDAYMFVPRRMEIHPVQTYLYKVIALSMSATQDAAEAQLLERLKTNVITIRAATVIITTIPIVFIYSLFQKHFVKGVMVGAVKG